jgi:hypothetical protein
MISGNPEIAALSFSYYAYTPQTVADARTAWQVSASQFLDGNFVENMIASTPQGHELAIHSDVQLNNGERQHLVMVDMATSSNTHLEKLRSFLGDNFFQRMVWFDSGRSFHGYGTDLLTEQRWVQFMGLLLLANKPRMEPTVDPRWIGHRLMAGYAALRWTKNTSHYLVYPARIDNRRTYLATKDVGPIGKRVGGKG